MSIYELILPLALIERTHVIIITSTQASYLLSRLFSDAGWLHGRGEAARLSDAKGEAIIFASWEKKKYFGSWDFIKAKDLNYQPGENGLVWEGKK